MAADAMHRHTGRNLAVAGMKGNALAIDMADHLRDMLHRKRMPQDPVAHAAPGRIAHLPILQMEARTGKAVEIAGVIIVQVRDDNIPDICGAHPEPRKRIDWIERELAGAGFRLFRVEASVDQDVATMPANQPDEVVEVLSGTLVGVRQEKIHVRRARRHGGIADRIDFIGVSHRVLSCSLS
jgi:hypothetical protein